MVKDEAVKDESVGDGVVVTQHSTQSWQQKRLENEDVQLAWLREEFLDDTERIHRSKQAIVDENQRDGGPRPAVLKAIQKIKERYGEQY